MGGTGWPFFLLKGRARGGEGGGEEEGELESRILGGKSKFEQTERVPGRVGSQASDTHTPHTLSRAFPTGLLHTVKP